MMTVGLGKQVGAQVVHSDGMGKIAQNIPTMAAVVLEKAPVLLPFPALRMLVMKPVRSRQFCRRIFWRERRSF